MADIKWKKLISLVIESLKNKDEEKQFLYRHSLKISLYCEEWLKNWIKTEQRLDPSLDNKKLNLKMIRQGVTIILTVDVLTFVAELLKMMPYESIRYEGNAKFKILPQDDFPEAMINLFSAYKELDIFVVVKGLNDKETVMSPVDLSLIDPIASSLGDINYLKKCYEQRNPNVLYWLW